MNVKRTSWAVLFAFALAACNAGASTTHTPGATTISSAGSSPGYATVPGWIVFEHFGQAPDGSSTGFNFDDRMIWLVHADGRGLHELAPHTPAEGKASPDISPDGTSVAFSSWKPLVRVREAPIEGGDPRLISSDCSGKIADCQESDPAYSADGKRLAFVRLASRNGATDTEIGLRNLASGKVTILSSTRVPMSEGYVAQPAWAPDGTEIVYYRSRKSAADEHVTDTRLFVVAADDSSIRELPQPAGRWAADPDWSPDGTRIVFSSLPNRESEGWAEAPAAGIYTNHPDFSGLAQICTFCLNGGWAPSWTPDGAYILFWGYQSWALMDPDGGHAAHVNQQGLTWFGDPLGYGYAAVLQPTR
jgi:TolB protein